MSVALDATVSGRAANSYIASVAEAIVLLDASPYLAAFIAREDEDDDSVRTQVRLLLRAAQLLDTTFEFAGYASETTQAMQHPRTDMPHPSGWVWDWTVIAQPVKLAQALVAAWLAAQDDATADPQVNASSSEQTLKSLTVGPVALEFSSTSTTPAAATPLDDYLTRVVEPLLSSWGLLGGTSGSVRLAR